MGNRLSKIVTKTGDDGTTSPDGMRRVRKDDPLIVVIGEVDEVNSHIGMARAHLDQEMYSGVHLQLEQIQDDLFNLGGDIAFAGHLGLLSDHNVDALERAVEMLNKALPPLAEFILPRGSLATCSLHIARAVARRAERSIVAIPSFDVHRRYLNRLSDFLFVCARFVGQYDNDEKFWASPRLRNKQQA
jgi:cob(I)alamin adenosyltransferase